MKLSKLLLLSLAIPLPLMAAVAPPEWSPQEVSIVTSHCQGDTAATNAINRHCQTNGCTDENWATVDQFCADLADDSPTGDIDTPTGDIPEPEDDATLALVSRYCNGDTQAFNTIQQHCQQQSCSPQTLQDIKQHCADLGIDVDTGLLIGATTPQDPPPDPGTSGGSGTSIDDLPADTREMLGQYCAGDAQAETTMVNYCSSNGCPEPSTNDLSTYCLYLGHERDMGSLIAANDRHQGNSPGGNGDLDPADDGNAEPPPPAGPGGSLLVSWSIPTERVDGEPLSASELDGYEIYITGELSGDGSTITIDDPNATEYTIDNLAPDTYYVALVAKDNNGLVSELSDIVSMTIEGGGA